MFLCFTSKRGGDESSAKPVVKSDGERRLSAVSQKEMDDLNKALEGEHTASTTCVFDSTELAHFGSRLFLCGQMTCLMECVILTYSIIIHPL